MYSIPRVAVDGRSATEIMEVAVPCIGPITAESKRLCFLPAGFSSSRYPEIHHQTGLGSDRKLVSSGRHDENRSTSTQATRQGIRFESPSNCERLFKCPLYPYTNSAQSTGSVDRLVACDFISAPQT